MCGSTKGFYHLGVCSGVGKPAAVANKVCGSEKLHLKLLVSLLPPWEGSGGFSNSISPVSPQKLKMEPSMELQASTRSPNSTFTGGMSDVSWNNIPLLFFVFGCSPRKQCPLQHQMSEKNLVNHKTKVAKQFGMMHSHQKATE